MMKRFLVCMIFLVFSPSLMAEIATGKAAPNDLYHNASPYLAMHGRDPVRWHLWNKKTIAMAKAQNKLLFVSSGYFSCRWCHVMQHESYQNPAIAALLNRYYIPVKVDRELSPALDARLIDFVERTQGFAGWPLNVFVTPEGYPLVGMVYVPPDKLKTILGKLEKQWQHDRKGLKKLAREASLELSNAVVTKSTRIPPGIPVELEKAFLNTATGNEDEMQGGFGQQNKFPAVPQLEALLQIYRKTNSKALGRFLRLTLDQMATQGLNDQLSGGFFRYCVDPAWHVPHFEKMLYDNAMMARLYLRAGQAFDHRDYTRVGRQTLNFVLHTLRNPDGGYGASLSALDDHGVEGGYYLWQAKQVKALLEPQEWAVASRIWQLDGPPDLDNAHQLRQVMSVTQLAQQLKLPDATVRQRLASARTKLLKARAKRHDPKDDKQLAAWNGLMLRALASAVKLTGEPRYRKAGQDLRDYLYQQLWDGKALARAKDRKGKRTDGTLEDYAYVIAGVTDWWELTHDARDAAWINKMIKIAWSQFYGAQGWRLAQHMLLKYGAGSTLVSDNAMPSASAVLTRYTLRFGRATHRPALIDQALRSLNVGHDVISNDPFWYATQIMALQEAKK